MNNPNIIRFIVLTFVFSITSTQYAFGMDLVGTVNIKPDPPTIISIVAADSSNNSGYSNGDTITVRFSGPTNMPSAATKSQLDSLFTFSQSLGDNYIGAYRNPSTLVVTISDTTNNEGPSVGSFTITIKSGGNLKNSAATSEASVAQSPVLVGNFGDKAGPFITDVTADDPDNSNAAYSDGDTITIRFSEPTDTPGGTTTQSKAAVNNLFTFTENLGDEYTGQWVNSLTFRITVNNANNGVPLIDITTTQPSGTTPIKNADSSSSQSSGASPVLRGSFGVFTVSQLVSDGSSAINTLPSGIMSEVTLPAGVSGTITVQKVEPTSTAASSGTIQFIGDVTDITPSDGATCSGGCDISFTFASGDLPASASLSNIKIFHDSNGDGDFADANEQLTTTITENPPGVFIATATAFFNSNFGIGSVSSSSSLSGSSGSSGSTGSSSGGGGGGHGKSSSQGKSTGTQGKSDGGFGGIINPADKEIKNPITVAKPIPGWIKNFAGLWSNGELSDTHFMLGVKKMIKDGVIKEELITQKTDKSIIPSWIKNPAKWWNSGKISDKEFVSSLEFLIKNKIIQSKS